MMLHLRTTMVQHLPLTSKDGRKHHNLDYYHYSHNPPHKQLLPYLLIVVQRQLYTASYYSSTHDTAKPKPIWEVMAPLPARQNWKACENSCNNYSKKKKRRSHRFRSSRTCKQSTQGCSNELLSMCRIQPTPPQHIRHNYRTALAVSWII